MTSTTSPVPQTKGTPCRTLDGMASTGETWRLGHRPALDGLRGIAVLLVLVSHLNLLPWTGGAAGGVGVGMFFTLSGFLITSLLVEEYAATRTLRLGRFIRRRAARLVPAMLVLVALVVTLEVVETGTIVDGGLILGTLTYTANLVMMGGHFPHWYGLTHTWSLGVEEQFYLLWPPVFLLLMRLPRRWALTLMAYAGLAAFVLRVHYFNPGQGLWRVYFGLDTRLDQILLGCGLAIVMHHRREARPGWWWAPLGGLAVLAMCLQPWLMVTFVALPTVVALGVVALIYGSVQQRRVRFLEWRPLRLLGERSYGVYLYQSLVFLLLHGLPHWATCVVILPVLWVLAGLSMRYVELPVRRWARRTETAGVRVVTPAPRRAGTLTRP